MTWVLPVRLGSRMALDGSEAYAISVDDFLYHHVGGFGAKGVDGGRS